MPGFSENIRDHVIAGLIVTAVATLLGSVGGLALVWMNAGGIVDMIGGVPRPEFNAFKAALATKHGSKTELDVAPPVRDPGERKNNTFAVCPEGSYVSQIQTIFNNGLVKADLNVGITQLNVTCSRLPIP